MSLKILKKGEFLYNEGDKIQNVILIQSGAVSLCLTRNKKTIDLFQLGSTHILGEQIFLGVNTYPTAAMATVETKVLEIPADQFKQQIEASPQMFKVIMKSLADRLKTASNEVRSQRMEKDPNPCSEDQVPRVFGAIFHTANHKGEKKESRTIIDWNLLRQYSQRVFGESPKRLEQAINVLVKLKMAGYEMGKDPDDLDGPELIQKVHLLDLAAIETFFEFYQYYYFKGAKADMLKIEENLVQMLNGLVQCAQGQPLDRFGAVNLDFSKVVDYFKNELSMTFGPDQLTRLESKGLFTKRRTNSKNEVNLQFDFKEFANFSRNWKILREIDKWNEKGFVDPYEVEKKAVKKASGTKCPSCAADIAEGQKFCGECGHKIVSAA